MTAFYRDVLGLQLIEETRRADWVEFEGDGGRFSLHAVPSATADQIHIASPPHPREEASTKLIFSVHSVEHALRKMEVMGLPLLRRPWGSTEAVDPEGNVFAVRAAS